MPASAARRKPIAAARTGLAPFSLKDAPAFIERQFPVGRLSVEAYKERKAVAGQTLTALGSYWKGRKPLVLVQSAGLVSDMEIETGKENEGPIRTNGWKFWHQMFMPRAI